MRFEFKFAMDEYKKIKKYLEENNYKCEVTGSLRRLKESIGDIDIVVTKKCESYKELKDLEKEILDVTSKYSQIKNRINNYEFMLKNEISIHIIPESEKFFNYTLWHSTGPKPHVKLVKNLYKEKNMKIDEIDIDETKIYTDIGLEYLEPKDRWKSQ